MFCNNCGKELSVSAKFCDNCGTYVTGTQENDGTGRPISATTHKSTWNWDNLDKSQGANVPPPNANYQNPPPSGGYNPPPNGGYHNPPPGGYHNPPPNAGYPPPNYNAVDDNPSGWAVLGFIMAIFLTPIIGLILYLVWKDSYPLKAAAVGKGTLTAVIAGVALSLILVIFVIGMSSCLATSFNFLPLL